MRDGEKRKEREGKREGERAREREKGEGERKRERGRERERGRRRGERECVWGGGEEEREISKVLNKVFLVFKFCLLYEKGKRTRDIAKTVSEEYTWIRKNGHFKLLEQKNVVYTRVLHI